MKLSFLVFTFLFAYAVESTDRVANGFKDNDSDPAQISVSVIDKKTADNLFREFASDKEIPFKYPIDGCYARATAMNLIAEKEHIYMGRVYAEGKLQVKTDSALYPLVQWLWHVAPVAFVQQPDGSHKMMVFDPSLFNKPVTVNEWTFKMLDRSKNYAARLDKVYYGDRFQYFSRVYDHEGYKAAQVPADLTDEEKTLKRYLPLQDLGPSKAIILAPVNVPAGGTK